MQTVKTVKIISSYLTVTMLRYQIYHETNSSTLTEVMVLLVSLCCLLFMTARTGLIFMSFPFVGLH
jgi:hypothetical protein